ncbi:MAG: serine hydrolase [Saprospiraceae bacterium]|nr:serine hydrolase [Saprospiraceae bacterium]
MESPSLGRNVLYQRKLKGYSQEKLADKTGLTVRTIQRIEKDEVNPHLETVHMIANSLEIKVEDLLIIQDPREETIQLKWLLLMHGMPLIGLMVPLFNILASVFLWVLKREDNPVYDINGRKIINFHITVSILFVLVFISLLTIEGYGFLIFILVIPYALVVMLVNIFRILKGKECYYPLSIPFIGSKNPSNKGILVLLLFIFFSNSNFIEAQNKKIITRLDSTSISKSDLTNKIELMSGHAGVTGLAVSVFENNKISYQRTFGYKDFTKKLQLHETTNIYGASISKAVFAVLVMKLVEDKVLDLDTPLESYLPKKIYDYAPITKWHDDYSDLKTDTLYHKITARMCLTHTCGFPNWRWIEPDQKLRVLFEPGHHYSYSGEGLVYLQVVLEKITGKSLESMAQEKIFIPLGMKNTSYRWQDRFESDFAFGHNINGETYQKDTDNEPRSASTMETTPKDLTLFLEGALQKKIISNISWEELMKTQVRIKTTAQFGPLSQVETSLYDNIGLGYGLGWGVLNTPFGRGIFKEGHGDGFQHYCILFPESGKGIMILTNSDNGESIFKELLELAIGDTFTPWKWEGYVPYNQPKK